MPETQADAGDQANAPRSAPTWPEPLGVRAFGDLAPLAKEAAERFNAGASNDAFALADRFCRLLVPSARDLLLRAQAHRAVGRLDAARRDLDAAAAQDPTDPLVARAALAWAGETSRLEAARSVVASPTSDGPLRRMAIGILLQSGARAAHALKHNERGVSGWLAWPENTVLNIEVGDGDQMRSFVVDPDLEHSLASTGVSVAEIAIEIAAAGPLPIDLLIDGENVERTTPPWAGRPRSRTRAPKQAAASDVAAPEVTIIVPVYEDFESTRACLEALEAARPAVTHRVVVVDDASPNAQLRAYLDAAADSGAIELLRNKSNVGFAVSVNAALASRSSGDVLLLNADAVLAPGAVDRLLALSRSSEDVGTLTPFSNNGELTSYPVPNQVNPMPSAEAVAALDTIARETNGDALVDLPNGVGFCLYITQACLDAVGDLPEVYAQGYYEDVEFCLAARERGFRNVATPGVYVGHAGSKSFGARKRALVMRNLELIEARFPGYRLETAAFLALDPLQPYRAALDAALPPLGSVIVVASGPAAADTLGQRRAERVRTEAPDATVLHIRTGPRARSVSLMALGGVAPQTLRFDFDHAADRDAFRAYVGKLDIRRVEMLDPGSLPEPALTALIEGNAEIHLLCADLNWFLPPLAISGASCPALDSPQPCEGCRTAVTSLEIEGSRDIRRRAKLGVALERATSVVPLDRVAEVFARRVFRARAAAFEPTAPEPRAQSPASKGRIARLGVLYPHPSAAVERLLLRLARGLAILNAPKLLVVIGGCLDDEALMATEKAFVTGPAGADEYLDLVQCYELDALFSADRAGGFGDLDATASSLGLPKAYFDWSFGALPVELGDLSLDPRICEDKAAARIVAWMDLQRGGGE
jgi:O-antigen biosynthesis protein